MVVGEVRALQAFELLCNDYEPFWVQLFQACIFIFLPASFYQNWPNKFKLVCATENIVSNLLLIFMFFPIQYTPALQNNKVRPAA